MRWLAACIALCCGCAHIELPQMTPGEEVADHHVSLRPLIEAPRDEPWEWAAPRSASFETDHLASGPMQASAWLWFRAYQATFSRLDGTTCRFRPTCSGFAVDAIGEHGLLGLSMAFGRLGRNHNAMRHYHMSNPPFLDDPLDNYGFGGRQPWFDDFQSYDDEAHAWYQHVRATRRLR